MYFKSLLSLSFSCLALLATGCSPELGAGGSDCEGDKCEEYITAVCTTKITNNRRQFLRYYDTELEYVSKVIACENGNGDMESLKAMAIAIRSFTYYHMTSGRYHSLRDSTSDQVVSCRNPVLAKHRQAVEETSGQVLRYRGKQVAGYYVRGAELIGNECKGGTRDPTRTQKYVTYNEGLSGDDVYQRGTNRPSDYSNRGGMSQLGSNCLADKGYDAEGILQFFYGADIEIGQASGTCIVNGGGNVGKDGGGGGTYSDAWVGTDCTEDASICDFETGGKTAECIDWFDDGPQELHGFCSIGCEGYCPDKSGEPSTFCAELSDEEGNCVVEPTRNNGMCADILGTKLQVVARYVGESEASESYKAVCAPPRNAVTCEAGGLDGECIDTASMQCGGSLVSGACPGSSNIRCCIE